MSGTDDGVNGPGGGTGRKPGARGRAGTGRPDGTPKGASGTGKGASAERKRPATGAGEQARGAEGARRARSSASDNRAPGVPGAAAAGGAPYAGHHGLGRWRVPAVVLLLVLGVLVAVAGALVQAAWFPGGLVLALAGTGALFQGGVRLWGGLGGVLAPGAAWLVTVIAMASARPEGDFLFGAGLGSYVFLLGGLALAVICATVAHGRAVGARAAGIGR